MAKKITEIVEGYLDDYLSEEGLSLYYTEFKKEGKDYYLRVYIDVLEEGAYVDISDCEKVSRYLSDVLDRDDPIEQNYYLEVSSPGMDRELFTEEHFQKYIGSEVDVKLFRPIEGSKLFTGELVERTKDTTSVKTEDGKVINLPNETVSKVQLAVII